MGIGHFARCMTLGDALMRRGATLILVSRTHAGNAIEDARRRGFRVEALPARAAGNDLDGYTQGLGVSQSTDATQTIEALRGERPDWLIVDHYGLGDSWERLLRPHVQRLMVIDDLPQRIHDCDLLLDQNEAGRTAADYMARVPRDCRVALGPRYALLRPEYARHRESLARAETPPKRVLVFFGGSDPDDMTGRTLEALSSGAFAALQVDVVVGANYAHRPRLEAAATARGATRLFDSQPHLADLLVSADLAIGAGGTTTWERLCLGVPSIVISIAENQRPGCEALAERGLIHYCGDGKRVSSSDIGTAVANCLRSPARMHAMSSGGQALVDGMGAPRIAEYLDPTPADSLTVRGARPQDVQLFFDWVNDAEVRRQSVNSEPISWQQHRDWFAARLEAPDSRLFVLLADELPVGQIRFDIEGTQALIDYSIDSFYRGRGWAKTLVSLGMRALGERFAFRAEVKAGNVASAAVFARLGFIENASLPASGLRVFKMGGH